MSQEHAWLDRLRTGDRAALRQIYDEHKRTLLTVAASMLADPHAAEDCLHEVFVRFAGDASRIRARSDLRSYLLASIANQARDMLRKRHQTTVGRCDTDSIDRLPIDNDPSRQMQIDERLRGVMHAMSQLSQEQREVVALHLQGEMTFATIADVQRISINTVQSRYRYGIDRLKSLLIEGDDQ
jgi:RNA polymerase sigma-70 factor (ECF subfamily)